MEDLEKEFAVIRKRLEKRDPEYKWENQLYHKVVQRLKRAKVSVTQAFEHFDLDHDGQLSRAEMLLAFKKLGLDDLSNNDVDVLFRSIDVSGDGQIQYKEFARKLERCGLRSPTDEEMLARSVIKTMKKLNMSKSQLFRFINKDGEGLLTRKDF